MNQSISIKQLTPADKERWDQFVRESTEATFFHLSGWADVLQRAFNHRGHYLFAEQAGQIVGVLPLAEVKSWLFGHSLVSTPFCVYGGPVAASQEIADQLVGQACEIAERLNVDHLELRNRSRLKESWPCKTLYHTFRRDISADEDVNLKAIPRKQRAVVRKAIKMELESVNDSDIGPFYEAYSTSVRNLGTPVFSRKYFEVLRQVFAEQSDILTIRKDDELVASVMSFYFKDEVLPYYGGGTAAARSLKGNDFMYWKLMCDAAERGVRVFDYGRSKEGTGSFSFKKNWGFTPEPLYYEYYLVKSNEIPDLNPLNPKYQMMIKCWQRLPLWLSQRIGPMVSKYLG